MKTILAPTDFSECSLNAVDYCFSIFDDEAYEIIILHALYIPYATTGQSVSLGDKHSAKINEQFDKQTERIKNKFPNHKATFKCKLETGYLIDVIKYINDKKNVHAIVIGTLGVSNLSDTLVGSQTVATIKNIGLPIFVVPMQAEFKQVKQILIAVDIANFSTEIQLDFIKEIAEKYNSHITILNVKKSGDKNPINSKSVKQKIDGMLENIPHNYEKIAADNIPQSIAAYVEERSPDLVVTINKQSNLFWKLFHRSVTKQVALHTETPLLVLHY